MRRSRKAKQEPRPKPGPDDTREMFTAGQAPPEDAEETREYETVKLEAEAPESGEPGTELPDDGEPEADDEEFAAADDEPPAGDELPEDGELEAIEDEAWEGDEYEDWEEDIDESGPAGPEAESESKQTGVDDFKAWFVAFRRRAETIWKRTWTRIGAIKLPRHEINGRKVLAVAGILAIVAMVGTAGYLLGKSSGDDVDQARLEGEFAGKRAGAIEGATRGYAAGFKRGRDQAFRKSYSASYKRNYIRAYDKAGMDAPKARDIEVPNP